MKSLYVLGILGISIGIMGGIPPSYGSKRVEADLVAPGAPLLKAKRGMSDDEGEFLVNKPPKPAFSSVSDDYGKLSNVLSFLEARKIFGSLVNPKFPQSIGDDQEVPASKKRKIDPNKLF
jgi:hypothetical protein